MSNFHICWKNCRK